MLKTKIAGAAAALALLAAPAVASAHDGHHAGGHHNKHHGKKAQARDVTGTATATVASFTGGELTLALPSGKTFAATVTDKTVLRCITAAPQATASRHGDDGDDDNPTTGALNEQAKHDADDDRGDDADGADDAKDAAGAKDGAGDDQGRGDENGNGRCGTDALVAGAKVSVANLSLRDGLATWKKVVVLK
jgi:hypothetical protein